MRHYEEEQTKEELLDIIASYVRMIDNDQYNYPAAVLGDIKASALYILERNKYYKRGVLQDIRH